MVYFDNYFSCLPLMEKLKAQSTLACGTIRSDRKGLPKNLMEDKKMKRGDSDFRFSSSGIGYFKWQDNKTVSLISNFHGSEVTSVKRKQKEVACPAVARDYKEMMGGVDHADQLRAAYGLNRRSKKWSHKLFWGFIDMCFVNAYIIYCTYHEKIPLLEFRWSKALGLLTQKGRQPRGIKRSLDSTSGTSKRRKQNFSVCSDTQPHQQRCSLAKIC